jgi:hypothetical protein
MDRVLRAVGAWFQRAYEAVKRMEDAVDYKYEDYAEERFKKMEHRPASLENQPKK